MHIAILLYVFQVELRYCLVSPTVKGSSVFDRILGRKNNVIEAWNNFKGLDPSFRNWTTDFQEAGYNLGIFGKMDDKASFKISAFLI